MWRRIFEPAASLPWSLARGNVADNLDELMAGDAPEEPMSNQMWQLVHSGNVPRQELIATVQALGQAGWTSAPAEQQHGSLAVFHRWHLEYGVDALLTRAHLLQVSRLLPCQTADEKRIARLVRTIEKMRKKMPEKAGGRQ